MNTASTTVVVADASVLINLIHIERLDLLGAFEGFTFVTPHEAVEEINDPERAATLQQWRDQASALRRLEIIPSRIRSYTG